MKKAAHCCSKRLMNTPLIFGTRFFNGTGEFTQTVHIVDIRVHQEYVDDGTFNNDICLLQLSWGTQTYFVFLKILNFSQFLVVTLESAKMYRLRLMLPQFACQKLVSAKILLELVTSLVGAPFKKRVTNFRKFYKRLKCLLSIIKS